MLRIILADDLSIFMVGVARTLTLQDDIRIVSRCTDSEQLQHAVRTYRPSIVIFAFPLQSDIQEMIRFTRASATKLIVFVQNTESLHMYAGHGFDGVVFRDLTPTDLVNCVRRVAAGETYFQRKSGRSLADEADAVGARVLDRLTPKEIQIVAFIAKGYRNKEIAIRLGVTEQVIKNYLGKIYNKTGVSDRLGLALFTIHHRILAEAAARVIVKLV